MKTIMFQGNSYYVPDWAKFITCSDYGAIEVWSNKPFNLGGEWVYKEVAYSETTHLHVSDIVNTCCEEIP